MTAVTTGGDAPGFGGLGAKLNWLRAAVLGANDGLVSGSGLIVGVAAAGPADSRAILTAAVAGLLAGAAAMAVGEYVSVSSQRDTEIAVIDQERRDLSGKPEEEFEELVHVFREQGLSTTTARQVVTELCSRDALSAHLRAEFGIHHSELTNPWHAALASAVSFTTGFLVPLIAMLLAAPAHRIAATFPAALVGLALTGWTSAKISGYPPLRPILRNVIGGTLAMVLTWLIGQAFHVTL